MQKDLAALDALFPDVDDSLKLEVKQRELELLKLANAALQSSVTDLKAQKQQADRDVVQLSA